MTGRTEATTVGRHTVALALSVACHAALILSLSRIAIERFRPGSITVTLVGDGGMVGSGGGGEKAREAAAGPASAAMPADADDANNRKPATAEVARDAAPAPPPVPVPRSARRRARVERGTQPEGELAARGRDRAALDEADGATASAGDTASAGGLAGDESRGSNQRAAGVGAGAGGGVGTGDGGGGTGEGAGNDLRVRCLSCPTPEYPPRARRQGWQGTVDVDVSVGRGGVVEHVSVGRSSGFALLDTAAVTVARRSRFSVSADSERLRGRLRYRFVLEGVGATF